MIIRANEDIAYLQATDSDGDWSCLTVVWEVPAEEMAWATHENEKLRATYLIHKIGQAYERSSKQGYAMGWCE